MQEDKLVKPISSRLLRKILRERMPDEQPKRIKYLGGGSFSAFSVDDKIVVKVPKLGVGTLKYNSFAKRFSQELKLRRLLGELVLPHEMVTPLKQLKGPTRNFRGPIFTYEFLSGRQLPKKMRGPRSKKVAYLLGDFLGKLHCVNDKTIHALGFKKATVEQIRGEWLSNYTKVKREVFPLLNAKERLWTSHLYGDFMDLAPKMGFKPVLIHGDLGPENVLAPDDLTRLQVVDFEDIGVGDPVSDFCVFYHYYGSNFIRQMLEKYSPRTDRYFIERIKFYAKRLPTIYFFLYLESKNKRFLEYARSYLRKVMSLEETY